MATQARKLHLAATIQEVALTLTCCGILVASDALAPEGEALSCSRCYPHLKYYLEACKLRDEWAILEDNVEWRRKAVLDAEAQLERAEAELAAYRARTLTPGWTTPNQLRLRELERGA